MAKPTSQNQKSNDSGLNFEAQLWAAADKMRGHMDASEYKHVCLGLIFLKYISDAFEEKREQLLFGFSDPKSEWFIKDEPQRAEAAENCGFSLSASIGERAGVRCRFLQLPPEARWHKIKAKAKSPEIGKVIDDAMGAIERENPTLKGVLPRDYARPSLDTATRASVNRICESHRQDFCGAKDHVRLGGLVDIISNIGFNESAAKSKDVLGRVYEYFLGKFASAAEVERKNDEGRKRSKGTHQTVCTANHSFVRKPAEHDGSTGSRQTAIAVGNIGRRELSGSAPRTKQSRVHTRAWVFGFETRLDGQETSKLPDVLCLPRFAPGGAGLALSLRSACPSPS